ncbi:MAG: thiamine pyrophosphate-dependent enzyme [Bacillota bacterium]|jgi:2-oxoglutarate ferredoxin oxidoreductase subunit beta
MSESYSFEDYIAWDRLPHMWCAGCGHGITLKGIAMALADLQIPPHKALIASGIGCSGRAGDYVTFNRFQGTHGRTLAFATGINAACPELKIIAFLGDGDCYAIGTNHLIHAARRNLNVAVIIGNNRNYGMTGGQFSPTTPQNTITSTSRYGKPEPEIDMCSVVAEAGASFVARTTVYHTVELFSFIKKAINTQGLSFVEVLSPCPTYFGRYNNLGNAVDMFRTLKEKTLPLKDYEKLPCEEKEKFFWHGIKVQRDRVDFITEYNNYAKRLQANKGGGMS